MIRTQITEDEITGAFDRLAASLSDLSDVMTDVGELMIRSTERNFASGTDPDGNPWVPRSQATLDAYASRKDTWGAHPLIGPSRTLSTTINYEADATSVAWGSNVIQSAVMQFGAAKGAFGTASNGSSIPWGDIPARPYLGLSEQDRTDIVAIVEEYLRNATGDGD